MTKSKQNFKQQKVSDDNSSDDDFSLSELTVKDKAGKKDKVQLTKAPKATDNSSVSKEPVASKRSNDNEKNVDVDKFRKEMDSLNKNPQANRQVIKDLKKRAQKQNLKSQQTASTDDSQDRENKENKEIASKLTQAVNKKLPDNINITKDKEKKQKKSDLSKIKKSTDDDKKEPIKKEKSQKLKENEEILFDLSKLKDSLKKSGDNKDKKKAEVAKVNENSSVDKKKSEINKSKDNKDDQPVIADPKVAQPPKPQAINPIKKAEDKKELVPEIDLDAEDIFEEEKNKNIKKDQANLEKEDSQKKNSGLEKVNLKSHSEIQRKSKKRQANVQNIRKTETIYDRKRNGKDKKTVLTSAKNKEYKTISPVEEIAILSLEEWRRFGDIAEERVAKVREKLELLGEKGILNQIKGLNAWRRSPVMQDYLDLGIKAILSDKGLEEYMEVEDIDLDKHLDVKEWLAINRLNRELMI